MIFYLSESFASYVGWWLAHQYYALHGLIASGDEDLTHNGEYGNARQVWETTHTNAYTPLFVDLSDLYNQRTSSFPNRPNDNIQSTPPYIVWDIITSCSTWPQCRSELQGYAGTGSGKYYTMAQYNEWILAFENSPLTN